MPHIGRQIRVGIATALCVLVSAFPVYAAATTAPATIQSVVTPDIFITEFQTNGGSAAQEFVELYNGTDQDIAFGDPTTPVAGAPQWKLQFFNSSSVKTGAPTWTTMPTTSNSITLTGTVSAHDYFLIASNDYLPGGMTPDLTYAASSSHLMTDTGGGLQLLSIDTTTAVTMAHDRVMWLAESGDTALPQGVLASPASGKSLQRIPNDDSEYVGDDGTLAAYGPEDDITPLDGWLPLVIVEQTDPAAETTDDNSTPTDGTIAADAAAVLPPLSNDDLIAPQITELLPNPASPLTDANDEFIELYNPNNAAFDLESYKLEVGTTTLHTYVFPAGTVIAPLTYVAFYSADTGLSLSNSGGQARFRDPAGLVLNETTAYGTVADNQAWILDDGVWQWSTSATPSVANILTVPVVAIKATKVATPKASATKTTKATTTKKASTTTAKLKTTKAKTTAAKKKVTAAKTAATTLLDKPKTPIHMGILVAVAALAVLYGLYEYRHDIAHKFRQLGRHRKTGLTDRLAPAGR